MFKMLGRITKNIFTKPATRKYPFVKREAFENTRGCIDADMSECILCGICSKKCPSGAIEINKNEKAWRLNPYKCIVCNVCAEACPKNCIFTNNNYKNPEYKKSIIERVKE